MNVPTIRLKNTLSGTVEQFVPNPAHPQEVRMYHCGPTVYGYPHVGNLRAYVFADTIRRTFEAAGYSVKQVINITDFGHLTSDADEGEDKMTAALIRENKPLSLEEMRKLGDFYADAFEKDLAALNIKTPTVLPKASDHIAEDIELIQTLLDKDVVYTTSDGLYFDTAKFPAYGKLGHIDLEGLREGARVSTNSEKRNPIDFVVWKSNDQFGWDAPWGKGFPGWHIECSAMSMKYLGESFDIHTGGIDHIPVHHNNEIAQSEAATNKSLATYWMHVNFITISNEKISKSLGNTLSLANLKDWNVSPLAYRYWLLTSHYSSQSNLTQEALQGAATAYKRLVTLIRSCSADFKTDASLSEETKEELFAIIGDDFDTPALIAWLWNTLKQAVVQEKTNTLLPIITLIDNVLGLELLSSATASEHTSLPEHITALKHQRDEARTQKNWPESDRLRDEIQKYGFIVNDTPEGTEISTSN